MEQATWKDFQQFSQLYPSLNLDGKGHFWKRTETIQMLQEYQEAFVIKGRIAAR